MMKNWQDFKFGKSTYKSVWWKKVWRIHPESQILDDLCS